MTKQREPQVGDVRVLKSLIYGRMMVHIRQDEININSWRHSYLSTDGLGPHKHVHYYGNKSSFKFDKYLGKLAPRYKRLFGIYYIPDNNG